MYNKLFKKTDIEKPEIAKETIVQLSNITLKLNKVKPSTSKTIKAESVKIKTLKFVPMRVVDAVKVKTDVPTVAALQTAVIGQTTQTGVSVSSNTNVSELPSNGTQAHVSNGDEITTIDFLESYPEFPGGKDAFAKYLSKSLKYPSLAFENGISGRVIVSFVIEKNGDLSNIKVLKGIGGGCDEEAIRVLKNSPAWKAGRQNGRNVRVAYTVPIVFQLGE